MAVTIKGFGSDWSLPEPAKAGIDGHNFTLRSDDTADQAARINTALADAAGGTLRLVGDFTIAASTSLVIKSDTTLDASLARIYCENNSAPLIHNENAVLAVGTPTTGNGANRDRNIHIKGGLWESGVGGGSHHRLFFHQVDGVSVTDLTVKSAEGKYAVLFTDVTNYNAERLYFDEINSDGVHVTGPARHGHIADITGVTHDDTVSIGGSDYNTYDYSRGDVSDLTIARVATSTIARKVLLFTSGHPGVTENVRLSGIRVRDISGYGQQGQVMLSCGSGSAEQQATITEVDIENVSGGTGASQGLVKIIRVDTNNQNRFGVIRVRGLAFTLDAAHSTSKRYGIYLLNAIGDTLQVSQLSVDDRGVAGAMGVHIGGGVTFQAVSVNGVVCAGSNPGTTLVETNGDSTIGHLTLTGVDCRTRLIYNPNNTQVGILENITLSGRFRYTGRHIRIPGSSRFVVDGVMESGTEFVNTMSSTAPEFNGNLRVLAGKAIAKGTGTRKSVVRSLMFEVDVSEVANAAGSLAFNTNAALSCGAGPVSCDGTAWTHLVTGATYTPPA